MVSLYISVVQADALPKERWDKGGGVERWGVRTSSRGRGGGWRGRETPAFSTCHRLRRPPSAQPAGATVNGPRLALGTAAQLAAVFTPDEVNAKDADQARVT